MRIRIAALALTLAATPLAAQTGSHSAAADDAPRESSTISVPAPTVDSRLIVAVAAIQDAPRAGESEAWADVVTRPWWHYPAIGAAIGAGAGLIHANTIMRGDYIGFPIAEPNVLLPIAYGAVGAFLGVLVDSADRERAARRD